MFHSMLKFNRAAAAGARVAGMAIAISSFTVVRAEHACGDGVPHREFRRLQHDGCRGHVSKCKRRNGNDQLDRG